MRPKALIVKPLAIKYRANVKSISQERIAQITRINLLHHSLDEMHKKVSSNDKKMRSKAQRFNNSKTNVILITFKWVTTLWCGLQALEKVD